MKLAIKYTLTLLALGVGCIQASTPPIQKLKKVSKPDDKKEWTVTIYKVDPKNPAVLGTKVSESKFKKNTDGRPKKLHFDFNNNDNSPRKIPNKIIIQEYGANKPEILIEPFKPIKSLNAQLNNDNTITFTPAVKPMVQSTDTDVDDRPKISVTINVPEGMGKWKIMSGGGALNLNKFKASKPNDTDTIEVSADGKPNKLLSVFATVPSKIVAQKGSYRAEITSLTANDLETLAKTKTITIGENGKATTTLSKPEASTASTATPVVPLKPAVPAIDPQVLKEALKLRIRLINEDYSRYGDNYFFTGNQAKQDFVEKFINNNKLPEKITQTSYYSNISSKKSRHQEAQETQLKALANLQNDYAAFAINNDTSKASALLKAIEDAQKTYDYQERTEIGEDNDSWLNKKND